MGAICGVRELPRLVWLRPFEARLQNLSEGAKQHGSTDFRSGMEGQSHAGQRDGEAGERRLRRAVFFLLPV